MIQECGDRVAEEKLEGLGHVLDRRVLVTLGCGPGRVPADGISNAGLNPRTAGAGLEQVPPGVVRAYAWIGHALFSHPGLDAHENEPTCAQSSGATECSGMIRCDMREQGRKRNALQI
jgi:hypothetical protein